MMTVTTTTCPRMLRYKPPRIAFTLLLLAALLHAALPTALVAVTPLPAVGTLLGLLGFGAMLRGWWLFRRHAPAICPMAATTTLITGDIYRLTRNPMYLGILLMLLGVAVATGGLAFYSSALAFFLIIDFVFCPFEEHDLRDAFGARYAAYERRVRRWL